KKEYYPLTSTQKKPFIGMEKVGEDSVHHNLSEVYILGGKLDVQRFDEIFSTISRRHENLRTSFQIVNGQAVQRVNDITFQVTHSRNTEEEAQKKIKQYIKPFDLSRAPLLRVELMQVEEEKYYVLFDMHHIISDATSITIMLREFYAMYNGDTLDPLPIQFKDYAAWQDAQQGGTLFEKQEKYWLEKMEGFQYTQIPYDQAPIDEVMECDSQTLLFETHRFKKLEDYCKSRKVTRFTFIMAVFHKVIADEIGQQDITVGARIATRQQAELNNLIGVLLSKIFIRSKIEQKDSFFTYLTKMNQTMAGALENSIYPYEMLAAKLKEKSTTGQLLSILVNYLPPAEREMQPQQPRKKTVSPITVNTIKTGTVQSRYDIDLKIGDGNNRMYLQMQYKKGIYKKERIKRMLDTFETIITTEVE
ncbi:MAG: hypothetical protein GY757_23205, partial [bacterium]|nr:hypothetical protein [bacterium]